jgi:beta-glucosidase
VAWTKIELKSGETKEVSVTVDPTATSRPLSYWNVTTNGWQIASGDYQVFVGASSRDIRLTGHLRIQDPG